MSLLLAAHSANAASVGSLDTHFGPALNSGRVRLGFDQGNDNLDAPLAIRRLADGRILTVSLSRMSNGGFNIAATVLTAAGIQDAGIGSNGVVLVTPTDNGLNIGATAATIAADGSYWIVGQDAATHSELRLWRYSLQGVLVGSGSLLVPGLVLQPVTAKLDSQGRVLVGGMLKPSGGNTSTEAGFVTRLTSTGGIDLAFALHNLDFAAGQHDRVVALAVDSDDSVIACAEVGNSNNLPDLQAVGLARILANGSNDSAFGVAGKVVENYSIGGAIATPCSGVGLSGTQPQRILAAGIGVPSAGASQTFVAAYDLQGQLLGGGMGYGNTGLGVSFFPYGSDGDAAVSAPQIAIGVDPGEDFGKPIVIGGSTYTGSAISTLSLARLDLAGLADGGFGDSGYTRVNNLTPLVGGSARDTFPAAAYQDRDGLLVASSYVVSGNFNVLITRFRGTPVFADGFE